MTDFPKQLPNSVIERATRLMKNGLSRDVAVSQAVSDLSPTADWDREDIATTMGYETPEEFYRLTSEVESAIDDGLRTLLQLAGGSVTIIAESDPQRRRYPYERMYITASFEGEHDFEDAKSGESVVDLYFVQCGASSGQPSGIVSVSRESFNSLNQLAEQKYITQDFGAIEEASKWYKLLVEAGFSEDELDTPGSKLPESHPDSEDHLQYQLRSIEPNEGYSSRRPPGER